MSKLTDNLIAYWKLDETTGNAVDIVGGNTLTNTSVTYTGSKINNGALFSGTSNLSSSTVYTNSVGTINLWIKTSETVDEKMFSQTNTAVPERRLNVKIGNNGSGSAGFDVINTATILSFNTGNVGINNNAWHMLTVTVDTDGNKFYVDGTQIPAASLTYATGSSSTQAWFNTISSNWVQLGSMKYNGVNNIAQYAGGLDEVGVWARALSAGEIELLYNRGQGKQVPFFFRTAGFYNPA